MRFKLFREKGIKGKTMLDELKAECYGLMEKIRPLLNSSIDSITRMNVQFFMSRVSTALVYGTKESLEEHKNGLKHILSVLDNKKNVPFKSRTIK